VAGACARFDAGQWGVLALIRGSGDASSNRTSPIDSSGIHRGISSMTTQRPLQILGCLAAIASVSILFGAVAPGVVAYQSDVFFQSRVELKLPKDARNLIQDFSDHRKNLRKRLDEIDSISLVADGKTIDTSTLSSEKAKLQKR
jgi:hypothetical protein